MQSAVTYLNPRGQNNIKQGSSVTAQVQADQDFGCREGHGHHCLAAAGIRHLPRSDLDAVVISTLIACQFHPRGHT